MGKTKQMCPKCKNMTMVRVHRHGFLQQQVFPKLGLYPWECLTCREVFLKKSRGHGYKKDLQNT